MTLLGVKDLNLFSDLIDWRYRFKSKDFNLITKSNLTVSYPKAAKTKMVSICN